NPTRATHRVAPTSNVNAYVGKQAFTFEVGKQMWGAINRAPTAQLPTLITATTYAIKRAISPLLD
ncbi:MAG TPA: hypothetical protein VGE45_04765, partial [Chloroflexia bacterium]